MFRVRVLPLSAFATVRWSQSTLAGWKRFDFAPLACGSAFPEGDLLGEGVVRATRQPLHPLLTLCRYFQVTVLGGIRTAKYVWYRHLGDSLTRPGRKGKTRTTHRSQPAQRSNGAFPWKAAPIIIPYLAELQAPHHRGCRLSILLPRLYASMLAIFSSYHVHTL